MFKTKIDELREKLGSLQKEREKVILEKGFAAEDNKDLRENAQYDFLLQKEHLITTRIHNILKEIDSLIKKDKPKIRKDKKETKVEFKPHKWL